MIRFLKAYVVLMVTAAVMSCSGAPTQGPPDIPVGVALPLTGNAAVYGKALQNGIDLAHSERTGGRRIVLHYEDDQGQAAQAVTAIRRLIDVHKVPAVIGGAMSSTAESTIPVADGSKVVLLSPTATKPELTKPNSYFLRLWPSDDYDGQVMAEVAYRQLGLRRLSILYVNLAYGVGITNVFKREFEQLGGTIVSSDGYPQGATDFRALLLKIRSLKPEAVYLPGYVAEIGQILRQAQQLGFSTRFIGVNSLYDPTLITVAGKAAEGAVFTYPTFDPASTDPPIRDFVSKYRARFGADPDAFAAQGYDAMRVLALAIDRLGDRQPTGPEILAALKELGEFQGPSGSFKFDEKGDVAKPLRLLTVRDGKFVPFQ